ncbi:lipase maturation factor 1-like [Dysidea avara]|uniref:lipase maturation factor 1-like n=1 Tax=Dysidea avara TaxID=196820 RepID=UPI0033173D33
MELRKRRGTDEAENEAPSSVQPTRKENHADDKYNVSELRGSFWLTRIVFIRCLGFVYFVAFLVALNQNGPLLGSRGLLPVPLYLQRVRQQIGTDNNWSLFSVVPTLLWWVEPQDMDVTLDIVAWCGLGLSSVMMLCGSCNVVISAILWLLYHSLVNVGQRWYSFGWESQLLETGFVAIFLSPVLSLRQLPRHTPTHPAIIWGYRWLLFRIMMGAGLIKLRGDQCWRDLTCMEYHYETQPVPNPLSYYLHHMPTIIHTLETFGNHFVELVAPLLLFLPRPFNIAGGLIQISFQVILIVSGNLSFLNWLTILPSIFCLDDAFLSCLFSMDTKRRVVGIKRSEQKGHHPWGYYVRHVSGWMLALLLGYLSVPVVMNLFSSRQLMNTSFDPLRIVNTYGAFGSVTKQRTEVIIEGSRENAGGGQTWLEYEFKCKPGNVTRRPCWISPYHYRLDWLMWFAAFQRYQHNPWLIHLVAKLLKGDKDVISLLSHDPFPNIPPRFIRARHYLYHYASPGSSEAMKGQWWTRELIGDYLPIVTINSLQPILRDQGWDNT